MAAALTSVLLSALAPQAASAGDNRRPDAPGAVALRAAPDGVVGTPRAGERFWLRNRHSRLCIGIEAAGWAGQWPCSNGRDQRWSWGRRSTSNAAYSEIVNDAGFCLGVAGGVVGPGARLVAYTCDRTTNQFWTWQPAGSAHAFIKNLGDNSGALRMSIVGASTARGAKLELRAGSSNDQLWFACYPDRPDVGCTA